MDTTIGKRVSLGGISHGDDVCESTPYLIASDDDLSFLAGQLIHGSWPEEQSESQSPIPP